MFKHIPFKLEIKMRKTIKIRRIFTNNGKVSILTFNNLGGIETRIV